MMKQLKFSVCFLILGLNLSAFGSGNSLKFASDEWCPYVCDPKSADPGLFPEVIKLIYEARGDHPEISLLNYARAIEDTRSSLFDAVIGCAREDAPDFKFPKEALADSTFEYFVSKKSSWKYKGDNSVVGKKIGIITGYTYDPVTMDLVKKHKKSFIEVSGDKGLSTLVKMLDAGRIDAFIESPNVFNYFLLSRGIGKDLYQSAGMAPQTPQKITVCFSPKSPNSDMLIQFYQTGIKGLKSSGKLKEIYKKYGFQPAK